MRVIKMQCELELTKFKNVINLLHEVSDECRLNVNRNGLYVKLVDSANVCMIYLDMHNTIFNRYTYKEDKQCGIDLTKLKRGLSKSHRFGNSVSVDIDDKRIRVECGSYNFSNELIPYDKVRAEPRVHSFELPNEFIISSNNLKNAFEVMNNNHAYIVSDNGNISIIDQYEEIEYTEVVFNDEITINKCKDAMSLLSLDYINDILKVMKPASKLLKVEFGKDFPIRISGYGNDVKFEYLQAPRIESD